MSNVLMKCGHTGHGTTMNGDPCCVICWPDVESRTIDFDAPDLTGRKSRCSSCGKVTDSSYELPFFEYRPDKEFDSHYNGCRGWE
jgi:hypothetical protein